MAIPQSWYTVGVADNTVKANGEPETASWTVPITTITAGNIVAVETAAGNLATAVAALSLGNNWKHEVTASRMEVAKTPSASELAQRENKYLARYHDAVTGKKFRVSFPCADLTVKIANSEFVDLSAGLGATLKTAFEAVVVSPDDSSHATVLDSVQFVARPG